MRVDSKGIDKPNSQYERTISFVTLMRDAFTGAPAVKAPGKRERYLPPITANERATAQERLRYERYVTRAEFDDIPKSTIAALVGSIFNKPSGVELPAQIAMMEFDADGDELELLEHMKIAAAELLQVEYIGLLAEYVGLADVDISEISAADSQNARPSIKMYNRESIINWGFRRVNGQLQLNFVVLKQTEDITPEGSYESKTVDAYLLLSLDENGNYYQQKFVDHDDIGWGEPLYIIANGQNLDFIPFEFCMCGDYAPGHIPDAMGYVYPIAAKTIARYQANADLKEALYYSGAPITTSKGWTENSLEVYEEMTGGTAINTIPGGHIPLPEDVSFEITQWNGDGSAIFKYLDKNEAEIRALGGVYDTIEGSQINETAKAASIRKADKSGVLHSLVDSLERSYTRVLGWCGLFVGLSGGAEIDIKLNREFVEHTLTPQQRQVILNEYLQGLISRQEALSQLEKGGVLTKTADELILEASTFVDGEE